MQTIKINRTTYRVNDARDIYAAHAKCTGKHKIVKSKGAEKRRYPVFYDGMSLGGARPITCPTALT